MTNSICGHKREVLQWVFGELERYPYNKVKAVATQMGDEFAFAVCDVDVPIVLAGIISETLSNLGFLDLSEQEFAVSHKVKK